MIELLRSIGRLLWGLYALLVFGLMVLTTTLLVAVVPGLPRRRRLARWAARTIFALIGVRLQVHFPDRLPPDACVVVANHASYLDGVILTAALPANFSFVIKREMTGVPLAHLLLRRLGSEFVERSDRKRGARDARRISSKAEGGHAIAFFPEGTFVVERGLGRFHNGAFATAARTGLPVVPVIIRGAREILPAEQWLPRRGALDVTVTEPIDLTESPSGHSARALLAASRARILEGLDEPDLMRGIINENA